MDSAKQMLDEWDVHLRENARMPNDPFWVEFYREWVAFKRDWNLEEPKNG